MSFHGGLLGVLVAALVVVAAAQRCISSTSMDFVAPLVPLGPRLRPARQFHRRRAVGQANRRDWGVVFPRALPTSLAQ